MATVDALTAAWGLYLVHFYLRCELGRGLPLTLKPVSFDDSRWQDCWVSFICCFGSARVLSERGLRLIVTEGRLIREHVLVLPQLRRKATVRVVLLNVKSFLLRASFVF